MKIRAGGQFHTRKPPEAAARASATHPVAVRPIPVPRVSSKAAIKPTDSVSLAAMPSMPSMKLNRLSIQTMNSPASKPATGPRASDTSFTRRVSMPPSQYRAQPAAMAWSRNRQRAETWP